MMRAPWICYSFALFLFLTCYSTTAHSFRPFVNPTANLSTTWSNTESLTNSLNFTDGSFVQVILLRESFGSQFACGFFCNGTCTSYLFAVFIIHTTYRAPLSEGGFIEAPTRFHPQVVWSANRDRPVSSGAILNLTPTGELVLQDADGSTVWTTNTIGKSVAGLNLTNDGNLVLFDISNSTVWQSFDYPTDCLLPGQALFEGQQLIASVSSTDWMAQKDLYSLKVTDKGLFAYVGSNPPQAYYDSTIFNGFGYISESFTNIGKSYVMLLNGSLLFHSIEAAGYETNITIPFATSVQYMKLMPDGHLIVFEWQEEWLVVADLFNRFLGVCDYPMACGRYGICSGNQQCSCPVSSSSNINYFREAKGRQPNLGCSEVVPLTCNATQDQVFIELDNITYFSDHVNMKSVDVETCKQACANNCSCKATIFLYGSDSSSGYCSLLSEIFTMSTFDSNVNYRSSAFLKVQNIRSPPSVPSSPSGPSGASGSKSLSTLGVILTSTVGSSMILFGAIGFVFYTIRKRRQATQMEEEYIDEVLEMPTRFSYEELKHATRNFNKKIGEGGFGAVYEGIPEYGSKIAVKCLEGLRQVNKSFLAEVKSVGSIHHVNLVRLQGFCAWKSQRFLVYEFMSNGSLDRWIYHVNRERVLEWECRKKIILDVAKGLAYLHDECRQKIIHLDIKPQNILLDNDFNSKVSDFGLSKLIDRNQTQVMTTMRGTPGYLAPEWMSSVITEKVDVYSFGIVLLETLCGRKNFDRSQPEESQHLLGVLQKCWEQGVLVDMVDKYSEDMQTHGPEVVEMIKVASWCLQYDFTKRPSMSTVVKVLEDVMKVESSLDYNFTDPRQQKTLVEHKNDKDMTPLLASVLSGPR